MPSISGKISSRCEFIGLCYEEKLSKLAFLFAPLSHFEHTSGKEYFLKIVFKKFSKTDGVCYRDTN